MIIEATNKIKLVSNLLPVNKPQGQYALKSKIDKSLQINAQLNMNRSRLICDLRALDRYIGASPRFLCLKFQRSIKLTKCSQDFLTVFTASSMKK